MNLLLASLACFLAQPPCIVAARDIFRHHAAPQALRRAIVLTLISAHLFGLGLILSPVADHLMKSPP